MPLIKEDSYGLIVKVVVQPRAKQTAIVGRHNDALKIRITAPPVDSAANSMCIRYLAKCLQVPKSSIEIISGHASRMKRLRVRYRVNKDFKEEKLRLQKAIHSLIEATDPA